MTTKFILLENHFDISSSPIYKFGTTTETVSGYKITYSTPGLYAQVPKGLGSSIKTWEPSSFDAVRHTPITDNETSVSNTSLEPGNFTFSYGGSGYITRNSGGFVGNVNYNQSSSVFGVFDDLPTYADDAAYYAPPEYGSDIVYPRFQIIQINFTPDFNQSHINYDKKVKILPNYEFLIPTYGNYGGPDYGGGKILNGGNADFTKPSVDALDELFKDHDLAYTAAGNSYQTNRDEMAFGRSKVLADLSLLAQIKILANSDFNADAHFYAAATTLAFIHQVQDNAPKYFTPAELLSFGLSSNSWTQPYFQNAGDNIRYFQVNASAKTTAGFEIPTLNINKQNPLNDDFYYWRKYGDVAEAHIDAQQHYQNYGWTEGRDPNAFFATNGYLAANTDVAKAGVNPLSHYDQNGWKEGRDPSANFDTELYLARNPDVKAAGIDPLAHYLTNGQAEGRQAYAAVGKAADLAKHPGFDAEYYLLSNADVAKAALAAGDDTFEFAYQHYATYGWHEGRNPNAVFDTKGYLATYTDVKAANIDPLTHYDSFGFKEGRDPSAHFDTKGYLAANGDVKAADLDPMLHYLQYGAVEGRTAFDDGHFA